MAHSNSLTWVLSLTVSAMAGLGKAAKGSEGELEGAGAAGRRVWWCRGSRKADWERRSCVGTKAGGSSL